MDALIIIFLHCFKQISELSAIREVDFAPQSGKNVSVNNAINCPLKRVF